MSWTTAPRAQRLRSKGKIIDVAFETFEGYATHRTGRNASLLAYFGILTIFPLMLSATTVLGFMLQNNPRLQRDIVDSAISKIPVIGDQIKANSGQISGSWLALAIGLGAAVWGSMRAFIALQVALDDIWEVSGDRGAFLAQRIRALTAICAIGVTHLGSVALAVLVGEAGLARTSQFLLTFGGLFLNVVLIAMLYRFSTSRDVTWSMVKSGTMFTAVLYTVLQFAGTKIMTSSLKNAEDVYGAFAGLLALASWISLHALIILIGAELSATMSKRASSRRVDDEVA